VNEHAETANSSALLDESRSAIAAARPIFISLGTLSSIRAIARDGCYP